MRHESLRQAVAQFRRRRPFELYTVELHGGERLVVRHPEALSQFEDLVVFNEPDGVQRLMDSESVLQFYSIAVPPQG